MYLKAWENLDITDDFLLARSCGILKSANK